MKNKIGIVGAGLVGSLLGLSLRQRGFEVELYEKRDDPRIEGTAAGRSINLALSRRGIQPLKKANVFDKIEPYLIRMNGRMMHDEQGNRTVQPYGKAGQYINSVSRAQLNRLMIDEAENEGVRVHFGHKCDQIDFRSSTLHFNNERSAKPDVVFGTDGAFSEVRKHMQSVDKFNFSQHYIQHGYKELSIDPIEGDFALEPNYLHIWPRGNFMLIALPNADKTFTCTLFLPFAGTPSFSDIESDRDIHGFFEKYFSDVIELIPDLEEQFKINPTSSLITTKCEPWHHANTLLLGDAAHAIVPFYGQGMNAGFEDVGLLLDLAESLKWDWNDTLPAFSSQRKKDADAISQLALNNFIEMRDHVANPGFLTRKELESKIQDIYPEEWIPLYSMVTFTDMPYSEALRLGRLQKQVLDEFSKEVAPDFAKIIHRFNALKQAD